MPHLIHTGEGTRVGLGQNETSRLGLQPSYSAHIGWENACKLETHGPFLFDFGGRGWALSEPGGSADARGRRGFRRGSQRASGSRHAPHSGPPARTRGQLSPMPGVFLVRIRSPASRRFSRSVKCPPFFFLPQSQQAFVFKRGGGRTGLRGCRRERGERGASPPGPQACPSPAPLLSQRLAVPSFLFRPSSPSGPAPGGHVSPEPWVSPGLSQAPGSSGSRCQLEGPALNLASRTRSIFTFITSHPASMDGSSEDVDGHKTGPF